MNGLVVHFLVFFRGNERFILYFDANLDRIEI